MAKVVKKPKKLTIPNLQVCLLSSFMLQAIRSFCTKSLQLEMLKVSAMIKFLTLSQTTDFKFFQTQRVCR